MQPSLRAVQALLLVLAFTALVPVVAYAQPSFSRLTARVASASVKAGSNEPTVWQASSRSGDAMSGDVFAPTLAAGVDTTQHRIKVILGVLGVAVSVLMAGGVGYLLRRRLGLAHTYEDGFTPKDPH